MRLRLRRRRPVDAATPPPIRRQPKLGPMTREDVMSLRKGCMFCGSHAIYEGAQGGLNTNFNCEGCGAGYNLGPANMIPFGCEITRGPTPSRVRGS